MTTENPTDRLCRRCGRTVAGHRIFHDPPATTEGLVEADIPGVEWHGLYCPPGPDGENLRRSQAMVDALRVSRHGPPTGTIEASSRPSG